MAADIPRAVLSERFAELVKGRRLKAAVFTTFEFDPGFFDLEILPVVLGGAVSHVRVIRRLQLEDQLLRDVERLAVYYDPRGLEAQGDPPRLPIDRIPVYPRTGYFHPKLALLLLEEPRPQEDEEETEPPEVLVVAALSANLTRAGWWENVEAAHIEVLEEDDASLLRDDIRAFMDRLKADCRTTDRHVALDRIRRFVLELRQQKHRIADDRLKLRLFSGHGDVVAFLAGMPQDKLKDLNLEVISPYFDKTQARPLRDLIEALRPREVRVSLPRGRGSEALVSKEYYDDVRGLPDTSWARLPEALMKSGAGRDAAPRRLHAKVLRFFASHRRFEAIFVGSANLTQPGMNRGGNFEAGFLVDTEANRVPDWWLQVDRDRPAEYAPEAETKLDEDLAGCALSITYNWATGKGELWWDTGKPSPRVSIASGGVPLFDAGPLPPREWVALPEANAALLRRHLEATALVQVVQDSKPIGYVLVREEGTEQKPSALLTISAADILRYWTLLIQEQRSAFLDGQAWRLPEALRELGLTQIPLPEKPPDESMFANFARIYQAFGNLEQAVCEAFKDRREGAVAYRLLGQKYDSLPNLLDRAAKPVKDGGLGDAVQTYVLGLCAKQLVREVKRRYQISRPEFFREHERELQTLDEQIHQSCAIRSQLRIERTADTEAFLDWVEKWFLKRAQPKEPEA